MKTRIELITGILENDESNLNKFNYQALTKELLQEIQRLNTALDELQSYFTSGNDIPVERATIKTSEFYRITQRSKRLSIL